MQVHKHVYEGQKSALDVFLNSSAPYSLTQSLPLNLELTNLSRLASQCTLRIHLPLTQLHTSVFSVLHGWWELNSGPHALTGVLF